MTWRELLSGRLPFPHRVFVAYACEQKPTAELLAQSLQLEGHQVFFDDRNLEGATAFTPRIRKAIHRADVFVFLISPESVSAGRFPLTELQVAEKRWAGVEGRILGVMVEPTPVGNLPAVLRATTFLKPRGDVVAETVNAVTDLRARHRRRRFQVGGIFSTVLALACVLVSLAVAPPQRTEPSRPTENGRNAPAAAVPTDVELAQFHIEQGNLYLSHRRWIERARAWARSNPLELRESWLSGTGVTALHTSWSSERPIGPEFAIVSHTGPAEEEDVVERLRGSVSSSQRATHLLINEEGNVVQFAALNAPIRHTGPEVDLRSLGIQLLNQGEVRKAGAAFQNELRSERIVAARDRVGRQPRYWLAFTDEQLFRLVQIIVEVGAEYRWVLAGPRPPVHAVSEYRGGSGLELSPALPLELIGIALVSDDSAWHALDISDRALQLALANYRHALMLYPGNDAAMQGITDVVVEYAGLIASANARADRQSVDKHTRRIKDLERGNAQAYRSVRWHEVALRGVPADELAQLNCEQPRAFGRGIRLALPDRFTPGGLMKPRLECGPRHASIPWI